MNNIKFGGCPFCGSQSCVAGQCQSKDVNKQEMSPKIIYIGDIEYIRADLAQPKREWVGLTDEERKQIHDEWRHKACLRAWGYEEAIEAKLKERNT